MNTFTVIIKVIRWRAGGGREGVWLVHDSSTRSRFSSAVIEIIRAGAIFCSAAKRRAINRPLLPLPPPFSHSPPPPPPPLSSSFYSPLAGGGSYALKAAMLHSSRMGNVYLILGGFSHFSREILVKDRRLILLMAQTETGGNESEIEEGKVPNVFMSRFSCLWNLNVPLPPKSNRLIKWRSFENLGLIGADGKMKKKGWNRREILFFFSPSLFAKKKCSSFCL